MQHEIAHLTQQLQATQPQMPHAVRQQVSAAQAQQSAQMNMLAHGLTQVHHLVQTAKGTATQALAAPALAGPYPGSADESMNQGELPRLPPTANPHLPPFTGSEDPGLWAFQAHALFRANQTPVAQQGLWMVAALRGQAMKFWFLECGGLAAEPQVHP